MCILRDFIFGYDLDCGCLCKKFGWIEISLSEVSYWKEKDFLVGLTPICHGVEFHFFSIYLLLSKVHLHIRLIKGQHYLKKIYIILYWDDYLIWRDVFPYPIFHHSFEGPIIIGNLLYPKITSQYIIPDDMKKTRLSIYHSKLHHYTTIELVPNHRRVGPHHDKVGNSDDPC